MKVMADTEVGKTSQHQLDIKTEKSVYQLIKNTLKTARGLSGQFWANFLFFCLLFTLMGSNGISFLAFYMVDIFQLVRKIIIKLFQVFLSLFLGWISSASLPHLLDHLHY